jgi:3-methyl-2-oxobutanoate hydroxymethyltransferase
VKVYGEFGGMMDRAVAAYAQEVKSRAFPSDDETYR